MEIIDARRANLAELAARLREMSHGDAVVRRAARRIVDTVRIGGDVALLELAKRRDGVPDFGLRVPPRVIREARDRVPAGVLDALRLAKSRIEEFHSRQSFQCFEYKDSSGSYGQKVVPLGRVGVYAPGGSAAYGSSVLMACVPARLAGVREIALCSPPGHGSVSPLVLAAASLCGVDEVYAVGGAQAVAAMAYGTATIPRVQKIVGPGGVFASAAKMLVCDSCEIDFLAGPSEVMVVADSGASPKLIASDLVAQLEHDRRARAMLVSDSRVILESAFRELAGLVSRAERKRILSDSYAHGAGFIWVNDLADAMKLCNAVAPEHLMLDVSNPRRLLSKVESAGSVFLGRWSSVSFGDYCAGTNHILPTGGAASAKATLSVYDFQKVIPYQLLTRKGARNLSGTVTALAGAEGLPCHARAALARSGRVA